MRVKNSDGNLGNLVVLVDRLLTEKTKPMEIESSQKSELSDLDHLIQHLMEQKNRYGNRPIVVVTHDDSGWYEGVSTGVDDEENEAGPIKLHLAFTSQIPGRMTAREE
jgi:hypothetical protein